LVHLKTQRQAIFEDIATAIARLLEKCDFVLGEELRPFEDEVPRYCGVPYSIGTDAFHLVCRALNLGEGEEVVLPTMTFASTASAVSLAGAPPVIENVRDEDALTHPEKIEAVRRAGCDLCDLERVPSDEGLRARRCDTRAAAALAQRLIHCGISRESRGP